MSIINNQVVKQWICNNSVGKPTDKIIALMLMQSNIFYSGLLTQLMALHNLLNAKFWGSNQSQVDTVGQVLNRKNTPPANQNTIPRITERIWVKISVSSALLLSRNIEKIALSEEGVS